MSFFLGILDSIIGVITGTWKAIKQLERDAHKGD